MDLPHQKRIQKLLKKIEVIDINDRSNLEQLSNYLKKNQNIYICRHPSGGTYHNHTHDFYEVNYLYEGDCINIIDGERIYMTAGDLVIMHPGTFHALYTESQSMVMNILIRASFFEEMFSSPEEDGASLLAEFMKAAKDKAYYKYIMCEAECVRHEMEQLMEEEAGKRFNRDLMQTSLCFTLLCKLLRSEGKAKISGKQNVGSHIVMDILKYMADNYSSVTLGRVSEEFGYSPSHICRMMLKETGKSFVRMMTEIKMTKALEYLTETNLKMYEIAGLLGYESHEYFQRVFKKHFGITPLQCRRGEKVE